MKGNSRHLRRTSTRTRNPRRPRPPSAARRRRNPPARWSSPARRIQAPLRAFAPRLHRPRIASRASLQTSITIRAAQTYSRCPQRRCDGRNSRAGCRPHCPVPASAKLLTPSRRPCPDPRVARRFSSNAGPGKHSAVLDTWFRPAPPLMRDRRSSMAVAATAPTRPDGHRLPAHEYAAMQQISDQVRRHLMRSQLHLTRLVRSTIRRTRRSSPAGGVSPPWAASQTNFRMPHPATTAALPDPGVRHPATHAAARLRPYPQLEIETPAPLAYAQAYTLRYAQGAVPLSISRICAWHRGKAPLVQAAVRIAAGPAAVRSAHG